MREKEKEVAQSECQARIECHETGKFSRAVQRENYLCRKISAHCILLHAGRDSNFPIDGKPKKVSLDGIGSHLLYDRP